MWCVLWMWGLVWKSKLFSRAKNVKKSEKDYSLELQVQQAIFLTLYDLGRLQSWLIRLVIISTWRFCTKIKIDRFHPKPWFPKTHHVCTPKLDFRNDFFDIFMSLRGKRCLDDVACKVAKTWKCSPMLADLYTRCFKRRI